MKEKLSSFGWELYFFTVFLDGSCDYPKSDE